jgi:hypothetical protein
LEPQRAGWHAGDREADSADGRTERRICRHRYIELRRSQRAVPDKRGVRLLDEQRGHL